MRPNLLIAALCSLLVLPAQAGRIDDAFRGFIERLRAGGQNVSEFRQSLGFREVRVPELAPRVDRLPLGKQQYAVFVTPGCRGCRAAADYLHAQGLDYEVLDVSRSVTARQAYTLTERQGFPVVLVGSQRLTGWNERLFKDAVRNDVQNTLIQMQGQGS